jgi:hypothetical protein
MYIRLADLPLPRVSPPGVNRVPALDATEFRVLVGNADRLQ